MDGFEQGAGFSARDRSENMRRAAEVAALMNRSGLISILAFVSAAPKFALRCVNRWGQTIFF